jgi:hypothetical protein
MRTIFSAVLLTLVASFSVTSWSRAETKESTVQVKFKNAKHAEHFMTWMSEQGEQDMYVWMEEAEPELAKMPIYDDKKLVIDYSQPTKP